MMPLIVLPTLDGSREAAVRRLGAWATAPSRRRMGGASYPRYATLGDVVDRQSHLDLHTSEGMR